MCATVAQSFLLVRLGMELTMSTIVIQDLYKNPKSDFSLTTEQVSWYGKHINIMYILVFFFRLDIILIWTVLL